MRSSLEAFIKKIPQPDSQEISLGEDLEALLDDVDSELFKRGTLAVDVIDWQKVQESSKAVLEILFHLQAARGLILALCQSESFDDVSAAFSVMERIAKAPLIDLAPQGVKPMRKKKAWVTDLCTALATRSAYLPAEYFTKKFQRRIETLIAALAAQDLDTSQLKKALQTISAAPDETEHAPATQIRTNRQAQSSAIKTSSGSVTKLDAKDRAQLRRDIQALSHRIAAHDPKAAIAYAMRGYAAWMEFHFLPKVDAANKTELQTMPRSIVETHEASLSTPRPDALLKLEDRLSTSPDWFEGHHLAYQIAEQLGFDTVSRAIRRRVQDRLAAFPELEIYRYANDAPFVSPALQAWLDDEGARNASDIDDDATGDEDDTSLSLEDKLHKLETQMRAASSMRDKVKTNFEMAKIFANMGLTAQASALAEEMIEKMQSTTAAQWDSIFLESIEMAFASLAKSE